MPYKCPLKRSIKDKISNFNKDRKVALTVNQMLDIIKKDPYCYLTGEKIDIYDTSSWHLDHITPRSRGGKDSLKNCGLTTKNANQAKSNMTTEEFIDLCKKVLENNGYKVEKHSETEKIST